MKPIILFFILFFIPNINFSQKSEVKVIEDLILEQKYILADSILKEKILFNNSVSSELTFLFGKNSFFLEKYEQSINWLNKYLELKGESGIFSDESIKFLEYNISLELFSYSSAFFIKNAGDIAYVPWHQDTAYADFKGGKQVRAWVAFTNSNKRNGCMRVIKGSHLRRLSHKDDPLDENNILFTKLNSMELTRYLYHLCDINIQLIYLY